MELSRFGQTPEGEALWPSISSPSKKFDTNGIYLVKLKLAADKAAQLVQDIDARIAQALDKATSRATAPETIRLAETPYASCDEGTAYVFSFKVKSKGIARGGRKYVNRVTVWGADGKPSRAQVTHGSIIRVNFEYEPYNSGLVGVGVKLKPLSVQIIEAAKPTVLDAEHFGFVNESVPQPFGVAQ
jgi:hypothetical protein